MIIKGTLKLDKIHYLVEKKDNKLFEDVNLQYMEPLEGSERDSEKGENSYNNYLKGVNEELNLKEKEITFINDLGLKNNLLNIKEIFDKIKKQNKLKILKTQNSLKSINKIILKNKISRKDATNIVDIEDNMYTYKKEENENKRKPRKRRLNKTSISKSLLSKLEIKKYLDNKKRIKTYDNINTIKKINKYFDNNEKLLNNNEKKSSVKRINSGRLYKIGNIIKEREEHDTYEMDDNNCINDFFKNEKGNNEKETEDIFGKKRKKNIIQDPFYLLEEEEILPEKENKDNKENDEVEKKNEEKKEVKKEETKTEEVYIHPLVKLEQDIKRINMKKKKKKKIPPKIEEVKENKNKNIFLIKRNKSYKVKYKETKTFKIENNRNRLKSPAINSILNDIKSLSKLILKKKEKKRKKNKNMYDKHFGYEYWKENEIRQKFLSPLTSIKRSGFHSFKSINSTIARQDTNSILSSNFSWLLKNNNDNNFFDLYNDTFSLKMKEDIYNPYSVYWTKTILKNSYNRKIKLKKKISGIPEIELISRNKSSLPSFRPKITYNIKQLMDKKNNNLFKKSNNLFGRIYNNNNVEFPFIYKS